ncbi:MAG: TetR/AcrR family transcriptional regulator [Flavobacteriaceae bacterium]|nr:TetR/AcrR family transcriptional regulator [Flavobacteriaceae bacterium]
MTSKAALTKQYIIETAAPIFNKYGYAATSLSTLTKVTGLTKGAIYGNFENKEDLAIKAFNYNVKRLFNDMTASVDTTESSTGKLYAIVDFYRGYYEYSKKFGGCPIINVGVDSNNQNTALLAHVRKVIHRFHTYIATIIEVGIQKNEIKSTVSPMEWSIRIDSMIQGATFMTNTMDNNRYIIDIMNQIDDIIKNELSK